MVDRPAWPAASLQATTQACRVISINVGYRRHFLEVTVTCDRYDAVGCGIQL
jgi:hypothetical protein